MTDKAYAEIKSLILSGTYPPGSITDAGGLAAALSLGRTPVREALLRLAEEEVVEILPKRGIRVVGLSPQALQELYEVVTALEVEAVGCLTRSPARSETVERLRQAVTAMAKALQADDTSAWIAADDQFHRTLLEACGNARLAKAGLAHRARAQRAHHVAIRLLPAAMRLGSEKAHSELVDLIESGDESSARELHHTQRRRGSEMLVEVVSNHGLLVL